jgi:hypothetical protein
MSGRFSFLGDVIPSFKIGPLDFTLELSDLSNYSSKTHGAILRIWNNVAGAIRNNATIVVAADQTPRFPRFFSRQNDLIQVVCVGYLRYRPLVIGKPRGRSVQRKGKWYGLEGWHWQQRL